MSIASNGAHFRAGIDIGGTFTDIVFQSSDGAVATKKISSTTDDYSRAIITGVSECLSELKLSTTCLQEIIHGTTVATNAILEKKGPRTGLITTRGFRDVLELRRLRTPELYNPFWDKPKPLVPRRLRMEVEERIDHLGCVVRPLSAGEARQIIERLVAMGVKSVAVCLLNSYANPQHEQIIKDLLVEEFPDLPFSISSEILPEIKEYERTSTTVINAYVMPVVEEYLGSLMSKLATHGIEGPLLIMQSNGGMTTVQDAMRQPMHIIESGPAAGVIATAYFGRSMNIPNLIAFDMGGTTAKASLVENGQVIQTPEAEIGAQLSGISRLMKGGGYLLRSPFVDVAEVGAGGGSIIWLDKGNLVHVGPQSAGASPGPVCYEQGGKDPTLTDANVVLGFLNPRCLLAGAMKINGEASASAISEKIAGPLEMDLHEAAWGIHLIGNSNMTRAIRAVSTERGRDPREFSLCAFGGSGPVHAATLATSLGIRKAIIPRCPGLFSAFGLLFADIEHYFKRTYLCKTRDIDFSHLSDILESLEREARSTLAKEGYSGRTVVVERQADLRYSGQSYELSVPLIDGPLNAHGIKVLEETFEAEHEKTYGHKATDPNEMIEIVNVRVIGRVPRDRLASAGGSSLISRPTAPGSRRVYFGPQVGFRETQVIDRPALSLDPVDGPLIVEEYDATTVVPPNWRAFRDGWGNVILEQKGGS